MLPPLCSPPHFQASSQGLWKSHLRDFCSIKSAKLVCLGERDPVLKHSQRPGQILLEVPKQEGERGEGL